MWSERHTYLAVWIISISTALGNFITSCKNIPNTYPDEFGKGWKFLPRPQDKSDVEWTFLTSLFGEYWFLLIVQILCTNLFFKGKQEARILFYGFYSTLTVTLVFGFTTSIFFLTYILTMFWIHLIGKKSYCYFLTISSLFLVHDTRFFNLKECLGLENERDSFLFDIGLAWLSAKCLSFAVDRIDAKRNYNNVSDYLLVLAYCLYLPSFFTGPVISYEKFCKEVQKTNKDSLPLKDTLLNTVHLLYYLSYYFVYEFLLHFIYSSATFYNPDIVAGFDRWSLCGLVFAMSMMFYLKYFTLFGIAGSFSKLEGIELSPPPKCFTITYLASLLSRHFDRGLHLWLLKYFYLPLLNAGLRRIFAQCVCFIVVTLWHGIHDAMCISSFLNCLLVASEIGAKHFSSATKFGKHFQKLSSDARDRVYAAVATPHYILLGISCSFFLSNYDIGVLILNRMFLGFEIVPLATLSFIMYCGCHVSMNVWKRQEKDPHSTRSKFVKFKT